jgi:lysophospholipase L1-like esterase
MLWKSSLDTEEDFISNLNTYGYRDINWKIEKDNSKTRIMFVGDSFVEGLMASDDQTIPKGFANSADLDGKQIEAMNFGMMGIGLNEFIKLIVDAVPIFKPDYVFLVLFSNDIPFERPYFPPHKLKPNYSDNFKPQLFRLLKYSRRNAPVPFRWSLTTKRYYRPVPNKNNPWTTQEATLAPHVTAPVAEAMKRADFNFFRSNWILEEEKFLKEPIDLKEKLKMINDYVVSLGSKLSVFYIPSRNQVSTYYYKYEKEYCLINCPDQLDLTQDLYNSHAKMLTNNCEILEIPFYDMTQLVIDEENDGNHLYWNYDDHMRGTSYMMLGNSMYSWWVELQD